MKYLDDIILPDGTDLSTRLTTLPKITAGAISAGPPSSPSDGDIWMATGVDANGTVWQFRYNAGSASAYKWEFIGGSPLETQSSTSQTLAASTWTALNNGAIVIPRAGDYIVEGASYGTNSTGGAATEELGVGENGTLAVTFGAVGVPSASYSWNLAAFWRLNGLAASTSLALFGWSNSATTAFLTKEFIVRPVRVS